MIPDGGRKTGLDAGPPGICLHEKLLMSSDERHKPDNQFFVDDRPAQSGQLVLASDDG